MMLEERGPYGGGPNLQREPGARLVLSAGELSDGPGSARP